VDPKDLEPVPPAGAEPAETGPPGAALRASEAKYRLLLETIQEGLWAIDRDSRTTFANERLARMLGYSVEEMRGRHLFSFMDAQGAAVGSDLLGRRRQGAREAHEFEFLRKDGSRACLLLDTAPILDEAGCYQGAIASVMDLTEVRKTEDSLRTSEKKYARIYDLSPEAIDLTHLESGVLVECNQSFIRMFGYTREELLGRTTLPGGLSLWVNREDRDQFLARLKAQGEVLGFESSFRRKDGSVFTGMLSSSLLEIGGDRFSQCICRDMTERIQAEAQRRQLDEQLNRTQALEALGVLVGGVAHNLNNVLAVIMGTASLHGQDAAGPAALEDFQIISDACRVGRAVIKSLLLFAQPSQPGQTSFELHAALGEVRTLLESTAAHRVEILERFAAGPVWVQGDAGSFSHAVMNLCLNALEAMPGGGTLSLATALAEPDWVEVSVTDTGPGMAPEVLGRALQPFYTTKEVGKGAGLGLSMAYGVAKAHGGALRLASEPGRGTTATLRLPRLAPPGRDPAPPPAPALEAMHVFLVDDDEDVRYLMSRMLRKAGVPRVRTFAGGAELAEGLRTLDPPDLVILDQNMPGMDGVQVMALIRERHPHMPILISSGQPDIEDWECFRRPGVGVISKPFNLEEIRARLARFPAAPGGGA